MWSAHEKPLWKPWAMPLERTRFNQSIPVRKMIELLSGRPGHEAMPLLLAALRRSLSRTAVRHVSHKMNSHIVAAVEPDEMQAHLLLEHLARRPAKLLLFGRLPASLRRHFGLQETSWPDEAERWSRSLPAPPHSEAQSAAVIHYTPQAAAFSAAHWQRPLERFDFANEWNNLGYGAVRADASIWSLAMPVLATAENTLAEIVLNGRVAAAYAALFDHDTAATLWFNRPSGPIDSFEWRLVERFLSSWRHGGLPCQPVLHEIPWGCEAAVTMRLDCDEDIASARALRAAYHEMNIPFSLAVHTANLGDARHRPILEEMAQSAESILSHTATHAPNWGGSYEAALYEAKTSADRLEAVTGQRPRYAVSPFHQTPPCALKALSDTGYKGCIGGIIRNDPEFLLARGGVPAGLPQSFVGHSQQCMMHGDCMRGTDDPIAIFKTAFAQAKETRTLFGYLDHPFSERYQYGWPDETARISTHRNFVAHIRATAPDTLFLSENDALDFLRFKSECEVHESDGSFKLRIPETGSGLLPSVEYAGNISRAAEQKTFS
ncbi:MAG: polysaccharide deacetylase family protein [Azoarcus sp.]|nr:polysaccharide deacetylase family protein [Azoarcus sp.]